MALAPGSAPAWPLVCPGPAKRSLRAAGCASGPSAQGCASHLLTGSGWRKASAVMCSHCHVSDTKGCGQGRETRGSLCDAPPLFRLKNCKVNSRTSRAAAWSLETCGEGEGGGLGASPLPAARSLMVPAPHRQAALQAPLSCTLALRGLWWRWGPVPWGAGRGSSAWDGPCLPVLHSASS